MQLVLSLLLATILVLLYFWRPKTRRQGIKLQGPQGKGLLSTAPYGQLQSEWFDTYGHTLAYRNDSDKLSILTCDPAAVAFIHREHDSILQPASIKSFALKNMGPSLMGVEGAAHRRQRRVIAPAFGSKAIRAMTPTFLSMAIELKNKLLSTAGQEIDVTTSIHQLTVDAIGSVAFGCEFGALAGGGHELLDVFYRMTSAAQPSEKDQAIEAAHVTMHRIGSTLVKQRTEQILAETAGGPLDKKSISANDVLTNLLRANMATDVAEDQRLSDEEVAAQIPLFLFAGNTTVAVTLDWASALLARYPDCSAQLFAETDEIGSDNPSWDTINALPYLDAFVKEVLRLYAPAPTLFREVQRDIQLPLAHPVVDQNGQTLTSVHVPAGTTIHIDFHRMNILDAAWGNDAHDFRPDRHLAEPSPPYTRIPGVWGGSATFSAGDRHCIGFPFAIAEIKSVLFILSRYLIFEDPDPQTSLERQGKLGLVRPRKGEKPGIWLIVRPRSE